MDKVIIDGADVSECDNLAILQNRMTYKEFTFCNAYQEDCSERENCYYKQLQRAKAENEELKKELEKHKSKIGHLLSPLTDSDFQDKLKKLEQENEELQARLNNITVQSNNEITAYKTECEQLKLDLVSAFSSYSTSKHFLEKEIEAYKQILEDIRDIAKQELEGVSDKCIETTPMFSTSQNILDLITKAEEENE